MITPEQARQRMPSARARAAQTVAEEIESFIAAGDGKAIVVLPLKMDDTAIIAELIEYKQAGWNVSFAGGCAQISLPEVVS